MPDDVNEQNRKRFVRWQGITLRQLGYAANLILTLASASLGFGVNLLMDAKFTPTGWVNFLFLASLVALLLSVGLGIWCVINRLRDYRGTKENVRLEWKNENPAERARLESLTKALGKRTWSLFRWQIGVFGAGVLLMAVSVAAYKLIERPPTATPPTASSDK